MSSKIIGVNMPNVPWQNRKGNEIIWRYDQNPIIPRDLIPSSNSIFNSAVVPFNGGFAGVFRCDDKARYMDIHRGFSKDGINWELDDDVIHFETDDAEKAVSNHRYDPRVCFIEDRYYITWCNGYHGPTIGIGYTFDFETFHLLENAFLPCNRNGVLFPRKINGKYAMLSRPSDYGHTPFGDIFYSQSPDMEYWGHHRHVMHTVEESTSWQATKIGAGPTPIETTEGWLMFYHGVLNSCNGFVYSFGAALLDIDKPWIVKARTKPYLISPQKDYECVGDVPNVTFPCAALADADTGKIAIYYGCADTVTGLVFCYADEIIDFIKNNSL